MKKNILVTGSTGQLGSELNAISSKFENYNFVFKSEDELDLRFEENVRAVFNSVPFDYCINCAAYTAVDKAEEDIQKAYLINETVVGLLAQICKEKNCVLIQISTDFIFNGKACIPYKENDQPDPISIYGKSKLAGENKLITLCQNYFLLRTSWLYSEFGINFVKTIIKHAEQKPQLNVIYDQIGTPTYAADLALTILLIIVKNDDSNNDNLYGIYHYSNEGVCSWYDFAREIVELNQLNCEIFPIETFQYPTPAKRPSYSVLNKAKIKSSFQLIIPHWKDSLRICIDKIKMKSKTNSLG